MTAVIGILGGMGPRATVEFERMLLDRLPGGDQSLPAIITINDGGIPDRTDFILGRGTDPVPRMQVNLTKLERLGAEIICIPCNTACAAVIFDRLVTTRSRLIHLPSEVRTTLKTGQFGRVGILATAGTMAAGTYQQICDGIGTGCVVPAGPTQACINAVIQAVKKNQLGLARTMAARVRRFIELQGCDAVILGCTELPLVADTLIPQGCIALDTLSILADTCVRYVVDDKKGVPDDTRRLYA